MSPTESRPSSIFSPTLDTLCVGGLSAIVIAFFLFASSLIPNEVVLSQFTLLTVLLNGTHFMASYRLLYASREFALRYKAASIYVPAVLCLYSLASFVTLQTKPDVGASLVQLLLVFNALYLALHYTGQAWGMMASFAFLDGIKFEPAERTAFRTCLRVLMAWQMGWALTLIQDPPQSLQSFLDVYMPIANIVAVATLPAGLFLFGRITRRAGRLPSARVMIPYFLLHLWYLFLWHHPQALFWVQISHALQYLSFPIRVELNRSGHAEGSEASPALVRRELLQYLAVLSAVSFLVFVGVKEGLTFGHTGFDAYWLVLSSCINIHHYFIDGCIWKISNPVVKQELFAHLKRPQKA